MVASEPDKWMWNIDEDFKFRAKDIRSFKIHPARNSEELYYVISVQLVNNEICSVPIKRGQNKEWCQTWIDAFVSKHLYGKSL